MILAATFMAEARQVARAPLSDGWRFRQVRGVNWYPATVPGVVHTDLMANGLLEDPFVGMNERAAQWVDKEDWEYVTSFDVPPAVYERENIRLVFEGLDTYADVYLNSQKVVVAKNMFRTWQVEVKRLLKPEGNELRVYLHSPVKIDLPKCLALDFAYPAVNDQSENGGLLNRKISVFARKAGYHYGWDWGPRLVTSGIWRPVVLEAWDGARFEDVHVSPGGVTAASARVSVTAEVSSGRAAQGVLTVADAESGTVYAEEPVRLEAGTNTVSAGFTLKNPRLWWPNGLGEPHLYTFAVSLKVGGAVADTRAVRSGMRDVRLVRERDADGKGASFTFEVNGHPVFMKGANYIPNDSFLTRVTEARYRDVVARARDANMNMLRVWGGGIYEDDLFYDLCDESGILIWQDFMFACSLYPADALMMENIRQEAVQNVKRLRNHPCIALWCGNNEMNDAYYGWGWKKYLEGKGVAELVKAEYDAVFLGLLPEVVRQYDPSRPYRSSSPISDFNPEGSDTESGDMHFWQVWHAEKPFTMYEEVIPRFMSEYGFQSFPELATVKRYAPDEKDWDIQSDVMLAHQRHPRGNQLIRIYMKQNYREAKDFRSFLYMSQLLQADGIRIAQEAHRRAMPRCMGTLYWQHNDCWPVASWSSSDYYGRWKAQHYFTRKLYQEVLVSPYRTEDALRVQVVSDRLTPIEGTLTVRLMTFGGAVVFERRVAATVPANASVALFDEAVETVVAGHAPNAVFVSAAFEEKGRVLNDSVYFLVPLKEVALPRAVIERKVTPFKGGFSVALKSPVFARGVYLSTDEGLDDVYSDNYFDLLPGRAVVVTVRSAMAADEFNKALRVVSMCDAVVEGASAAE